MRADNSSAMASNTPSKFRSTSLFAEPENPDTFRPEQLSAFLVINRLLFFRVLTPVDLDRKLCLVAVEIDNERPKRVLPTKLET